MDARLGKSQLVSGSTINIPGSKSESNRLLILQAIYPQISIANLSDSDDTMLLRSALSSDEDIIDVGHAGTAMRFLTAYFASIPGRKVLLTGSPRMKQRPIGILVEALRKLGAKIEYKGVEGYPPLSITGSELDGGKVELPANISSQYITALMLIAPKINDGIEIVPKDFMTSAPYVEMTLSLLRKPGIDAIFDGTIKIAYKSGIEPITVTIESDWSAASYFYSCVALSSVGTSLQLSTFRQDSIQGDSELMNIYRNLGVDTSFDNNGITLTRIQSENKHLTLDLNRTPDIAQTIAVTCLGLGISCELKGLATLKIKETDRLLALKNELEKLGATVTIFDDSLSMIPTGIKSNVEIATYDDHRMAMAFAPLAMKVPITISDRNVVSKSYPGFWDDFQKIGFQIL